MPQPACPYCGSDVWLTSSSFIKWEQTKPIYICSRFPDCDARVNCHPGTVRPIGSLANPQLRRWREKAHRQFDQLWRSGRMSRKQAYQWLAQTMNLPESETHFAQFDQIQCQQAVELVSAYNQTTAIGARYEA